MIVFFMNNAMIFIMILYLLKKMFLALTQKKMITNVTETFNFISSTSVNSVISIGNINLLHFEINENKIICTLLGFLPDESVILK